MVFHLEGVAFHADHRAKPGHDLMGQRANVHERLQRIDKRRESRGLDRVVHVQYIQPMSSHAFERVKHDEARARGQEISVGDGLTEELEAAVGAAFNTSGVADRLAAAAAGRAVTHAETVCALVDDEVRQHWNVSAPVFVAHEEGDCAQDLDACDAQVAQVATIEFDRQWPGRELAADDVRLVSAAALHGSGGFGGGHVHNPLRQ